METSIIIRTKNEEKWIGTLLDVLQRQTYKDFEMVIVDSGSTDGTLEIVKKFPVKIVQIKPEEFTYPHALNVGCGNASAEKYFVFVSAHSIPITETWLEDGIGDFTDDKIMGVYGTMRALPDGSVWEKLIWNVFGTIADLIGPKKKIIRKAGMGVMGFTHAIIRRNLWKQYNFDEAYGMGGEDMAWTKYWFSKGYVAVKDTRFRVMHSHGLGIVGLLKQFKHWESVKNPHPFEKLTYRK